MNAFKPRETLTEQVARHIENLIAFNQLKGGQRIYEGPMAKELSVSHGSVREALLLLEKNNNFSLRRLGEYVHHRAHLYLHKCHANYDAQY